MTKKQKEAISRIILDALGTVIESQSYKGYVDTHGMTDEEIAEHIGKFAQKLPGDIWDDRIPLK